MTEKDKVIVEDKIEQDCGNTVEKGETVEAQVDSEEEKAGEEVQDLGKKMSELEQEKEECIQKYLRLRADFENYRRRTKEELLQAAERGKEELVSSILPILDNFERAFNNTGEIDKWRDGIEMIFRQLQEVLANEGVVPIPAVGEVFDPKIHEAVFREPSAMPENTILEELKKGYLFGDKTLRPSLVKVAAYDPELTTEEETN